MLIPAASVSDTLVRKIHAKVCTFFDMTKQTAEYSSHSTKNPPCGGKEDAQNSYQQYNKYQLVSYGSDSGL